MDNHTCTFSPQYLAGLVDGEGYFSISIVKRKNATSIIRPSFVIGMHMEAWDLLNDIKSWGETLGVQMSIQKQKCGLCRISSMSPVGVQKLLEAIYPYLIIKKAQADRVLEFCRSRPRRGEGKKSYTDRDFELVEQCKRIPFLNKTKAKLARKS